MTPKIRYYEMGAFPVFFGVCFDKTAFAREMKRLGVDPAPDFVSKGAAATCHELESSREREFTIIICLDPDTARGRPIGEIVGLLAHEATHAMQSTIDAMNDREPSREMQAYLVQHFTQSALAAFQRRKAKK